MYSSSFSYRQVFIGYSCWWICWITLQSILLHRLGVTWDIALTDASISNILLAIAGYVTENTYRYYRPRSRNILQHLGWSLALTFVCMFALRFILSLLYEENIIYLEFLSVSMPLRYMFSLLMIAFITVVSWLWFYVKEQQENAKRKEEAERLLRDAELSKLHQQLQPHFLFNSLNSISALAGTKPEEARKMIQQLSDFLRGTLKKGQLKKLGISPLKKVSFVKKKISKQQI